MFTLKGLLVGAKVVKGGQWVILQVASPREGVHGMWVEQYWVRPDVAKEALASLNGHLLDVELLVDVFRGKDGSNKVAVREVRVV